MPSFPVLLLVPSAIYQSPSRRGDKTCSKSSASWGLHREECQPTFTCFHFIIYFLLPGCQLQPCSGPLPPPIRGYGLSGSDWHQDGVTPSPEGSFLELRLEQGRQQSLGTSTGIKTNKTSPEPLHCQVSTKVSLKRHSCYRICFLVFL